MQIKTNSFSSLLSTISYTQLILISMISLVYLFFKEFAVYTALLIVAIASFSYTQLLKLSTYYKIFALFGFPVRITLIALPCAILVHRLHSNLLALFLGFVFGQVIYFVFIWRYARREMSRSQSEREERDECSRHAHYK